jgi:hypothetical protein
MQPRISSILILEDSVEPISQKINRNAANSVSLLQAGRGGTHARIFDQGRRRAPGQNLVGEHPKPF